MASWGRFWRQCLGLSKKNLLIRSRSWQNNLLQVFQAVLFVFLIWAIDRSVSYSRHKMAACQDRPNPQRAPVGEIPNCNDNIYLLQDQPCFDFLYSPVGNTLVEQLVTAIRDNNVPPIPASQVLGFPISTAADSYLLAHPQTALATVQFDVASPSQINFVVQTNSTVQWFKGAFQNPNTYVQLPLQMAVEREVSRYLTGDTQLVWDVGFTPFPHPASETASVAGSIAPTFLFASAMFNLVLLLHNVVHEKESGVRQAMKTMGLMDSAFWLTWAIFEGVLALLHALLICATAAAFQFDLVLRNDFGLVFLLLFMTNLALTAFGFFLSTFLRRASASVTAGFVLFIVAWIFLLVIAFGFPYNSKYSPAAYIIFSLFPWCLLGKGIQDLATASSGNQAFGIGWSQQNDYCLRDTPSPEQLRLPGYYADHCVLSVGQILWVAALQYLGYMALAVYFDNVLPDRNGVRKAPWYFLQPSYWRPSQARNPEAAAAALKAPTEDEAGLLVDNDVRKETQRMRFRCQQYIYAEEELPIASSGSETNTAATHSTRPAAAGPMADLAVYNAHFQRTSAVNSLASEDSITAASTESTAFDSVVTANTKTNTAASTVFGSAASHTIPSYSSAEGSQGASKHSDAATDIYGTAISMEPPSHIYGTANIGSASFSSARSSPAASKRSDATSTAASAHAGTPEEQGSERSANSAAPGRSAGLMPMLSRHPQRKQRRIEARAPDAARWQLEGLVNTVMSTAGKRPKAAQEDFDEDAMSAVEMFGLRKVFRTPRWWRLRKSRKASEFVAVRSNWLGVKTGECFCLLGPNGAGKTTTINCLTGVVPASAGDALIYGRSVTTAVGLERARALMGVCPQFDVLWDSLTGREHLLLFAAIKGLPPSKCAAEADELLDSVRLLDAADQRAAAYSGGMRRRLSVAIALLGQPKVLFLDEPTTGMDPISRRYLWEMIAAAKARCAVVLTTHSMEEADILGDRIAIMARGRLRCIGSGLHLKQRFGSGYRIAIHMDSKLGSRQAGQVQAGYCEAVKALVQNQLGITPQEESSGEIVHFAVPPASEGQLPGFFAALKAQKAALRIGNVQVRLAPLEEVFLAVARKAELENAREAGETTTLVLEEEGGIAVEVPTGAPLIESPSGARYRLKWVQDEEGRLVLNDHHQDEARPYRATPANLPMADVPSPARLSTPSPRTGLSPAAVRLGGGASPSATAAGVLSHPILMRTHSVDSMQSADSVGPAESAHSSSTDASTFVSARTGSLHSMYSVYSNTSYAS
ncbi:hypothetical protein WJX72_001692 [[Myrmecia] bisecta]|uniref:ABC transporter domain-containing protein n=1 Tax=[Myrmecia] bisecta TaxID=41462 RepID=A0AAW1R4M2_9CHLO